MGHPSRLELTAVTGPTTAAAVMWAMIRAIVTACDATGRQLQRAAFPPPPLAPVANRPLLAHGLDALRDLGIRHVSVVVDADDSPELRAAVGERRALGARPEAGDPPARRGRPDAAGSRAPARRR